MPRSRHGVVPGRTAVGNRDRTARATEDPPSDASRPESDQRRLRVRRRWVARPREEGFRVRCRSPDVGARAGERCVVFRRGGIHQKPGAIRRARAQLDLGDCAGAFAHAGESNRAVGFLGHRPKRSATGVAGARCGIPSCHFHQAARTTGTSRRKVCWTGSRLSSTVDACRRHPTGRALSVNGGTGPRARRRRCCPSARREAAFRSPVVEHRCLGGWGRLPPVAGQGGRG